MRPRLATSSACLLRQCCQLSSVSVIALFTSSCSFLLDFDKFETRYDCARCRDEDPCNPTKWCTDHECLPMYESTACPATPPPAPVYERCAAGELDDAGSSSTSTLLLGHRLADLEANGIGKTQILVGSDFLYHVAYVKEADHRDVILRAFALSRFGAEPNAAQPLDPDHTARVSTLLGEDAGVGAVDAGVGAEDERVRSPGSIAVDAMNRVVLYVAHGREGEKTATLSRIVFQPDLSAPTEPKPVTDPPNYRVGEDEGRVGPAAGYLLDGTPFVAWQGCEKSDFDRKRDLCAQLENSDEGVAIFTHSGEDELGLEELNKSGVKEPLPVSALQALSEGAVPAAVWGTTNTENAAAETTLTVGAPDQPHSLQLLECFVSAGFALNSIHVAPTYNGRSSVVWSQRLLDGSSSSTEATSAGCGMSKCFEFLDASECDEHYQNRVIENVRAAALGVWRRDLNSVTSEAITINARVNDVSDGETRLTVAQTQGFPGANDFPFLEAQPNEYPLAEGNADWPELSLQSPAHQRRGAAYNVVGVGWVERDAKKGTELAKLQTFDLCLAK